MSQWTDRAALIPWVRRLSRPVACEGIRWKAVAGRDIHPWGPGGVNPPRGIPGKAKCKRSAWWHLRALPASPRRLFQADSGNYCWAHLWSAGLMGSTEEDARLQRWVKRNHPDWLAGKDLTV